jgi:hypothetical protein
MRFRIDEFNVMQQILSETENVEKNDSRLYMCGDSFLKIINLIFSNDLLDNFCIMMNAYYIIIASKL